MDETDNGQRASGIQVVSRVAQVLRELKESPGGLTQAELASALGLPRTTVFRLLSALVEEEFVAQSSGSRGRYRVGPEIGRLASAATRDLVALLHPLIDDLSRRITETVDVSVLDDGQVLFIDQVDAPHRLRAASAVGEHFPLHTCAPGKAMLASLSPRRLKELTPSRLVASTAQTVSSPEALYEQLEEVRRTGIAYDYEEQNDGICAAGIALAVAGTLVAVSIPIPAQRFADRGPALAAVLRDFRDQVLDEDWA